MRAHAGCRRTEEFRLSVPLAVAFETKFQTSFALREHAIPTASSNPHGEEALLRRLEP
jgi:hypothetical protein